MPAVKPSSVQVDLALSILDEEGDLDDGAADCFFCGWAFLKELPLDPNFILFLRRFLTSALVKGDVLELSQKYIISEAVSPWAPFLESKQYEPLSVNNLMICDLRPILTRKSKAFGGLQIHFGSNIHFAVKR